ncbi:hypothetical protein MMC30_004380 [Trapelia coarctata]|nr:hypothetical protein [Trapelia coarctata]
MVPIEDPMELSTDMEKRFLGDEDIDIDLSLDGRSPYAQEDEYMLEDAHSNEDQRLYDNQQEGNDDEMADETEATEDMDKIQEDQQGDSVQDLEEFDILVDDEEIPDVEDTVIFSDDTTGLHPAFPYQVGESSEQQTYNQFPEQSYSNQTNGTYHEAAHPDGIEGQSVDFMHDLTQDIGISTTTAEQADATSYTTDMPEQNINQEHANPSQMTGDDPVEISTDTFLGGVSTTQPLISAQEEVTGEDGHQDRRSHGSPNRDQLGGGSPDRTSKAQEELAEQTTPKDPNDPGPQIGVQSENQEAPHLIADEPGTETVAFDTAVDSFEEQGKNGAPEETSSLPDRAPLHPVIVVYQESEILLFPPHEHGEDQAQTYFLEDESLATQTIQSLLGACRLVLADSINDDVELELKITSLGLEICETSNASTTTTLAQVLDIYSKLHHNDGLDNPDPLQMTLTTKLSFHHRLEYLRSAVAGGVGFLDAAQLTRAKNEYMGEFEEESEYDGDNFQEKTESFKPEADNATEEGSNLTEALDGAVKGFIAPDSDTNYRDELEPAGSMIGPTSHERAVVGKDRRAHSEEATGANTSEEISRLGNTPQGGNTQPQQDQVHTPSYDARDSFEHTEPIHEDSAVKNESKERAEGKHISSPSSSTLRGDESDFAGDHDRNSLASVQLPASDDYYSALPENESGTGFHAVTNTEQPELSNQTYEEDGDVFDLEDLEDIDEAHGANQDRRGDGDHGASGLPADRNDHSNEDKHEVQDGLTTPMFSKEVSKGNSDIDNDEITYDDEDNEDDVGANHEDINGINGPGNSPRRESKSGDIGIENGLSGGQRESLKRLRPGEDEEPAQGHDTQGK